MNLLEIYILEIHSVETENIEHEGEAHTFVTVDATTNCYGNKKRQKIYLGIDAWERAKKLGYYMG